MKIGLLAGVLATAMLSAAGPAMAADTVVLVVRHAEKATDDPADPHLSSAGHARATALAAVLAQTRLDAVYVTQFRRTTQTAQPAAQASAVEAQVRPVDLKDPVAGSRALAKELAGLPPGRTVLVVGHSNTVPDLVEALSGQPVPAVDDAEFDRLYVITLGDSRARVVATTYGERFIEKTPAGKN